MKSFEELCRTGEIYENEEERESIMNMSEVQREIILHEKYNKMKKQEVNILLKEMSKNKAPKIEDSEITVFPKYQECDFLISRDLLINNIFKPFVGLARGSFVRAVINGKYSICKIAGFCKTSSYELCDKLKTKCTTALILDLGEKTLDEFQVNSVSSSNATEEEFREFCKKFKITRVEGIRKKYEHLKQEFSRSMTDDEKKKTIEARQKDNPKKKTNTQKKIEIISMRDEAIQLKNKDEALRLQKQLEKIEDEEREERKKRMLNEKEARKKECL